MDTLQLTLVIALIVMALINTGSLIWAFYLDHRLRSRPVPKVYNVTLDGTKAFTEVDLAAVEKEAQAALQKAAQAAAAQLESSMNTAIGKVAEHVDEMTNTTLSQEFEKYQISLQALREQSITEFSKMQKELDERKVRLIEALEKEAQAEIGRRVDQFNGRLNDVVSSYLAESLGNNVDLGSQMVHILQTLQQHKEEIKRDIVS